MLQTAGVSHEHALLSVKGGIRVEGLLKIFVPPYCFRVNTADTTPVGFPRVWHVDHRFEEWFLPGPKKENIHSLVDVAYISYQDSQRSCFDYEIAQSLGGYDAICVTLHQAWKILFQWPDCLLQADQTDVNDKNIFYVKDVNDIPREVVFEWSPAHHAWSILAAEVDEIGSDDPWSAGRRFFTLS